MSNIKKLTEGESIESAMLEQLSLMRAAARKSYQIARDTNSILNAPLEKVNKAIDVVYLFIEEFRKAKCEERLWPENTTIPHTIDESNKP